MKNNSRIYREERGIFLFFVFTQGARFSRTDLFVLERRSGMVLEPLLMRGEIVDQGSGLYIFGTMQEKVRNCDRGMANGTIKGYLLVKLDNCGSMWYGQFEEKITRRFFSARRGAAGSDGIVEWTAIYQQRGRFATVFRTIIRSLFLNMFQETNSAFYPFLYYRISTNLKSLVLIRSSLDKRNIKCNNSRLLTEKLIFFL